MYEEKKILVKEVFEKAKKELPRANKSSIAAFLSSLFEERYGASKDERTFVRFYKSLIEDSKDYNIDDITLDQLSAYIGYKNFNDFCEKSKENELQRDKTSVKIAISSENGSSSSITDTLSNIIINITNSPVFTIPEFITKHSQSIGLIGILILGGFIMNNQGWSFYNEKKEKVKTLLTMPKEKIQETPNNTSHSVIYVPTIAAERKTNVKNVAYPRKKECMYWTGDHYEAAFCDEVVSGVDLIAFSPEKLRLKKISRIDTLNPENAMGKVWYDKSNKNVEFFTSYGIHPENGKTLKPVTQHILNTYGTIK